uniref:Endonuclease/exonuclease/phosphatase domain-containing protein n=1 Tax=Oncorhynchus tshawytscha TaxID=74940 RepID=A0AAZ3RVI7_ONCTS
MWGGETVENVRIAGTPYEGLLLAVDFSVGSVAYCIINVYSPNVVKEREGFFRAFRSLCNGNTILVGDFNVRLGRLDVTSSHMQFHPDTSRKELLWEIMIFGENVNLGGDISLEGKF